jgi:glutathione peroxidase
MNRKANSFVRKFLIIAGSFLLMLSIYVWFINRDTANMTIRQKILRAFYPILIRIAGANKTIRANLEAKPSVSFYSLEAKDIHGNRIPFSRFKGKKVLLVNTASDCGFTPQYNALQKLYEKEKNRLEILAFPSNDYKQQEKGSNEAIATFCSGNYGVTFMLMDKIITKKISGQHAVYQWLTHADQNGWNEEPPSWNFSKYLINEEGQLTYYFDPAVSPLDEAVRAGLNQ